MLSPSAYLIAAALLCGTLVSGTGMEVGEGADEAMTLAMAEEGAEGLR